MVDRFLVWVSAGILTAGVSAATIAGAGLAAAEDGAAGVGGKTLAQGWIADMCEGSVYNPATRTGIYGEPGEPGDTVIDIPI